MLDLKAIRDDPELFREGLRRRGVSAELDRLLALDEEERRLKVQVEDLRAEQNRTSKRSCPGSPTFPTSRSPMGRETTTTWWNGRRERHRTSGSRHATTLSSGR